MFLTSWVLFALNGASTQCKEIDNCRTLQTIVYSCLSTIFLCTWAALHMDVPPRKEKLSPFRRVKWVFAALVGPEVMLGLAFDQWIESCDMLKDILGHSPQCGWTETHAVFAHMGGFRLVRPDGEKEFIRERDLFKRIQDGTVDVPDVTEEEIRDRSKGDPIAKTIVVIQTAWFVIQIIHRLSLHLPVTELEFTTLAHTVVNFFVYWCWWYKPLGIAFPIDIPAKKQAVTAPAGEKQPVVVEETDEKSEQQESDSGGVPQDVQLLASTIAKGGDQDQSTGNGDNGDESHQALKDTSTFAQHKETVHPPHDVTNSVVEENAQLSNASNDGCVENSTKTSTGNKEDDPTVSTQPAVDLESLKTFPPPRLSFRVNLGSKLESTGNPDRLHLPGLIILSTIVFIVSGAFGVMHCLAWNSDFPSHTEKVCWRVSSLLVTSIGATMMAAMVRDPWKDLSGRKRNTGIIMFILLTVVYCCARVALLVLAFLQLWDLPFAAYVNPSWASFYPHIN